MKKNFSVGKIILIMITAFITIYFIIMAALILYAQSTFKWADKMNTEDSWGEEAIWKSENDDMYLICQKTDYDLMEVKAFMLEDNKWIPLLLHTQGRSKLCFAEPADDEYSDVLFTADMNLKKGKLIIKNFNNYFAGHEKIVLEKYSYDSLIDKLPFEY